MEFAYSVGMYAPPECPRSSLPPTRRGITTTGITTTNNTTAATTTATTATAHADDTGAGHPDSGERHSSISSSDNRDSSTTRGSGLNVARRLRRPGRRRAVSASAQPCSSATPTTHTPTPTTTPTPTPTQPQPQPQPSRASYHSRTSSSSSRTLHDEGPSRKSLLHAFQSNTQKLHPATTRTSTDLACSISPPVAAVTVRGSDSSVAVAAAAAAITTTAAAFAVTARETKTAPPAAIAAAPPPPPPPPVNPADVAPAPVAATATSDPDALARRPASASASALEQPPSSFRFPRHLNSIVDRQRDSSRDQTPAAHARLPKRERFRRKSSHILQFPPVPTSPTYALAGPGPSSLGPLKRNGRKDQHDAMPASFVTPNQAAPYNRADGGSSSSGLAPNSRAGIMTSNESFPSAEGSGAASTTSSSSKAPSSAASKPFIKRFNRTYIHEPSTVYPLPVDLSELHRQSLRTLLNFQLFGGPIISPAFANKPPSRVLEVGCGSAFWSMMCHRYFAQHGHSSISFTGLDIVPLAGSALDPNTKPDKDMRWRFVQHDIRKTPWPFADGEFDLLMVKDMSLTTSFRDSQPLFEEYARVLKPGGVLELWETDSTIRMLRPHVLKISGLASKQLPDHDDSDSSTDEDDEVAAAQKLGAYVLGTNTPLSAPLNPFLVEYNGWATKALDQRGLSPVPCTLIGPYLLQESEILTDVRSKRLAVPLSEIRWEREGVGGVVTKDGKSYIDSMKGKGGGAGGRGPRGAAPAAAAEAKGGGGSGGGSGKTLTTAQAALRKTALETTVGLILSLEPLLRETSEKSQDEWDGWAAKMVNDLLRDGGTSWGECLEVGAWTARKRQSKKS